MLLFPPTLPRAATRSVCGKCFFILYVNNGISRHYKTAIVGPSSINVELDLRCDAGLPRSRTIQLNEFTVRKQVITD